MIRLVHELAADGFPVAVACRVLGVSPSRYYEAIKRAPSAREIKDRDLTGVIVDIHHDSRAPMGLPGSMLNCAWAGSYAWAANASHD